MARKMIAKTPMDLKEQLVPSDDQIVAWTDPWTYYKAVAVIASAAHPSYGEGEVIEYCVGKFLVNTNHPKAKRHDQGGLRMLMGSRIDAVQSFDELRSHVIREAKLSEEEELMLRPTRPTPPPIMPNDWKAESGA